MNKVPILIRLVFSSLILTQIGLSQNGIQEPELLVSPPLEANESMREHDPDLFYEWEGDPRWLTGVNWEEIFSLAVLEEAQIFSDLI